MQSACVLTVAGEHERGKGFIFLFAYFRMNSRKGLKGKKKKATGNTTRREMNQAREKQKQKTNTSEEE